MRTCVYVVDSMLYNCTINIIRYNTVQKYCSYRMSFPAVRMRFGRSFFIVWLAAILLLKGLSAVEPNGSKPTKTYKNYGVKGTERTVHLYLYLNKNFKNQVL